MDDHTLNNIPLPPNPFDAADSGHRTAYQRCLAFEDRSISPDPNELESIAARVLGHLLRLTPSERGKDTLSREINDAPNDDALKGLAEYYMIHFIRAFKRVRGLTPDPSECPSPHSLEDEPEQYMSTPSERTQDHRTAKTLALSRDGYHCMVSGKYDMSIYECDLDMDAIIPEDPECTYTHAVHIIPDSTATTIGEVNEQGAKDQSNNRTWTVLSMFGPEDTLNQLNGDGIHRLENILTLDTALHKSFDDLRLWLKPVPNVPNEYEVHGKHSGVIRHLPTTITFSTNSGLPLPSREYLALHALCCEVAHMSGATEYIENFQRDWEEMGVLAADGSSAQLLSFALSSLAVH